MNNDNIVKIPINSYKRHKNKLGKRAVACAVTDRWLQFGESSSFMGDGEYVFVNVMTSAGENEKKKLCFLCISKEDILSALNEVKSGQQKD